MDTRAMELMAKGTLALAATVILAAVVRALFADAAERKELLSGAAAGLLFEAFLFFAANLTTLHVRFCETKLVRQRGLWPFKKTDIVNYATITRVRASDRPVEVTVDLDDGRRLKLAHDFTEVQGPLPEPDVRHAVLADQRVQGAQRHPEDWRGTFVGD